MELLIKERKSDHCILSLKRGKYSNHHVFNVFAYTNFLLKYNSNYKIQREIVDFFDYILTNTEVISILELTNKIEKSPIINSLEIIVNND
jgi:hypothetical protein